MIDKNALMAKAQGFTIAFGKMGKEERSATPDGSYGEDYNRLRQLAIDQYPDLEPLMPPAAELVESSTFGASTRQSFSEINTYSEQIYQILSGLPHK